MSKYKFSDIAINSTEKKKPVEEDKYTYIGLEHLDSGTLTVSRWGAEVAPIGEKLIMKKGDVLFAGFISSSSSGALVSFETTDFHIEGKGAGLPLTAIYLIEFETKR